MPPRALKPSPPPPPTRKKKPKPAPPARAGKAPLRQVVEHGSVEEAQVVCVQALVRAMPAEIFDAAVAEVRSAAILARARLVRR